MKKIILLSIFITLITLSGFAATGSGTPSEYEVTINKVQLYNDTTGEWIVVHQGDQTFDIAEAQSANQLVGSLASGVSLTKGTYTKIQVKVKRFMTIRGSVSIGITDYYTTGSTTPIPGLGSGEAVVASTDANDLASGVVTAPSGESPPNPPAYFISHVDDGSYMIDTMYFPTPFTIEAGNSQSITINFDLSGTLICDDGDSICWCLPPNVTITASSFSG